MADNAGGGGLLLVLDSTFVNNFTSGSGGALDLEPGSKATVVDSTFTGNYASKGGGAIGVFGQSTNLAIPSSLLLSGSTLFGNVTSAVSLGGGLYVQGTTLAAALVRDTIVAGNTTQSRMSSDVVGALEPDQRLRPHRRRHRPERHQHRRQRQPDRHRRPPIDPKLARSRATAAPPRP